MSLVADDCTTNYRDVAHAARSAAILDRSRSGVPNLSKLMHEPYFKELPESAVRLICWAYNQAGGRWQSGEMD